MRLLLAIYPSRRAAFRQAKRDAGIPTSQNFISKTKGDAAKNGKSGRKSITYEFQIEPPYDYTKSIYVQDHYEGHIYINGMSDDRPHINIHQKGNKKERWENNHYYYIPKNKKQ